MPRRDPLPMPAEKRGAIFDRQAAHIIIPIEIWLDHDLPILAKVLFAEIDSLSKKKGYCFASNTYLAGFLDVSEGRISQLIGLLKNKEMLVEKGRENRFDTRTERRLFIPDGAFNKLKAAFNKLNYIYNSSKEELKKDYINISARQKPPCASLEKVHPAKQRAESRRKQPNPAIQRIVDHYIKRFTTMHGERPRLDKAKDYSAAKRAIAESSEDRVKQCVDFFFDAKATEWERKNGGLAMAVSARINDKLVKSNHKSSTSGIDKYAHLTRTFQV